MVCNPHGGEGAMTPNVVPPRGLRLRAQLLYAASGSNNAR